MRKQGVLRRDIFYAEKEPAPLEAFAVFFSTAGEEGGGIQGRSHALGRARRAPRAAASALSGMPASE